MHTPINCIHTYINMHTNMHRGHTYKYVYIRILFLNPYASYFKHPYECEANRMRACRAPGNASCTFTLAISYIDVHYMCALHICVMLIHRCTLHVCITHMCNAHTSMYITCVHYIDVHYVRHCCVYIPYDMAMSYMTCVHYTDFPYIYTLPCHTLHLCRIHVMYTHIYLCMMYFPAGGHIGVPYIDLMSCVLMSCVLM